MHHGVELGIVLVVCFGLGAGVVLRWAATRSKLPYTVAMLLMGMAAGFALKQMVPPGEPGHGLFAADASLLSPDLVLFVFLPPLVFESAFALDVHAFRRNAASVVILAAPAMVVSLLLVGAVAWATLSAPWGWGLGAALVFGALISATDPVAVVAVLRELGAPKRLSLLIEGESLLNDGTAMVAFTVLVSLLLPGTHFDAGGTTWAFVKVVAGGVAVGFVIARIASAWLARTFNDPVVEMTVTLVMAYAAMAIAEGLLHVSGVMAIVTVGLYMAGPGRTRISPEVIHSLHAFWEVLAFMANTLIFFLVGVVIALHLSEARWLDAALIGVIFVGVVVARFLVMALFYPLLARMAEPVTVKESVVMAWGGLRGAVSLALALLLSQTEGIDENLRLQVLRLTAGVVLLTILVNGTTAGALLRKLGFVTPSPAEKLSEKTALGEALSAVDDKLAKLAQDPELAALPWARVRKQLVARREKLAGEASTLREEIDRGGGREHRRELWRRAIAVERDTYWRFYGDGVLGAAGLKMLVHAQDLQLDELRAARLDPPKQRAPELRWPRSWAARWTARLGVLRTERRLRLAHMYDTSRAEADAAEEVLVFLDGLGDAEAAPVRRVYAQWRKSARLRLEDLRQHLPEVVAGIEERLAQRILLNLERERVRALGERGVLAEAAATHANERVEERMKRLARETPDLALPETAEVCVGTRLFVGLAPQTIAELADLTREEAFGPGDVLFEQGEEGDAAYVVARGALRIVCEQDGEETELDIASSGALVGEMALLSGERRNATAVALTSGVAGRIPRRDFDALLARRPRVRARIWATYAQHTLDRLVPHSPVLADLVTEARHAWIDRGELARLDAGEEPPGPWILLLIGALSRGEERCEAPAIVRVAEGGWRAECTCRVLVLPDPRG